MPIKNWKLPNFDKRLAAALAKECSISEFAAEILVNRGITSYLQADWFLSEEVEIENPFALIDMERAVGRIRQAVEEYESIVIYGDYDCDGVTATAVLYSYLSFLGANVSYYIPKREGEGYGLHCDALTRLSESGASLIITVDNGISALEEIEHANDLGLTVVITDHHQPGDILPSAYAIVNPHRKDCQSKFKDLAGVGVAFKVVAAMEDGDFDYAFEQFADLLAIGTVGDLVPLIGENRLIVKLGLEAIRHTDNLGLAALMEEAGISPEKLSSQSIAFGIAPRINAAGRMKDAAIAAQLLLSDDSEQAVTLAQEINELNNLRKSKEDGILDTVRQQISEHPELLYDRVLTFYEAGWHAGIIGIVSSKLLELYGKPNILMTLEDDGVLRGSARSVAFFSMYKALVACDPYLDQYGGHTQAAGLTLKRDNYTAFKEELERFAMENFRVMPGYTYEIDKEIMPGELTMENIRNLEVLEPFGSGNQQPLFLLKNAGITGIFPVSDNKHLRLKIKFGGMDVTAMYFGISTDKFLFREGDTVDFLCNIGINYYNGREYLSVSIRDIRLCGFEQSKFFNAKAYYEMFRRGENLSGGVLSKSLPDRNETAEVYKYLLNQKGYSGDIDMLYGVFGKRGMNYCKFRMILDILSDVNLISVSPLLDGVTIKKTGEKVDLETSETMVRLKRGT